MAFVKVVLCIIAFVLGIGLMQGVDFLLSLLKKRGVNDEKKNN